MNDEQLNYAEITVPQYQLQNYPESQCLWFVQHGEEDAEREMVVQEMVALIRTIMEHCLTPKQKVIVHLYYEKQWTQEAIAVFLCIRQESVNNHLIGQMKRGKVVGGASQKIRKSIRKEAAKNGPNCRRSQLISALHRMLDASTTRRHTARIFKDLLGKTGNHS